MEPKSLWRGTRRPDVRRGADTYHVAITRSGYVPARWEWEIYRNGQPLREQDFGTERTAKAAGAVALREFLEALSREQNL